MSTSEEHDPGLVVLSLDGGGVRGLSSLLILKECMTRLQHQLGLNRRPEVYEHFDMVGGTGTGGISAVMLGRLRIPLDRAIERFAKLATDVFSERKYLSATGSGAFKSTKIQQAVKSIIRDATGNENERMMDYRSDTDKCKTVVFAMSKYNMNAGLPRAFRSYQASVNQMPDCAIWEALCATTAHPDLFKSIDIGDTSFKESFVDRGLGCSNPLAHTLAEVKLMYPNRRIACVVRIGAGHARTIHIPSFSPFQRLLPTNVIEAMKEIATDSEQEAQRMAVRFNGTQDVYFRLNVDQGMQSVELGDWERTGEVTAHTRGYMQHLEVTRMIEKSAMAIKRKKGMIAVVHIDGQAPVMTDQIETSGINACPPPTSLFVGREEPVGRAAACLLSDVTQRKIFVIHGLGGAGKTQIALRVVEKTREHWSDIIFADATSVTTMETMLKDFASRKGIGDTYQDTLRWMASTAARWLLIVDNADDPGVNVVDYLPRGSGGRILITTRNQELVELAVGSGSDCNVSSMEVDDALQLLLKASRRDNEDLDEGEMHAAKQLLQDFGCLPLAITQAGGYIRKNHCTFAQYYSLYLQKPEKMMQKHSQIRMQLNKYERTTFDTWMLSYELLGDLAQHLLGILGYMQRDRITVEIFRRAALNVRKFESGIPLSESEQEVYNHLKEFLGSFLDPHGDWDLDAFLGIMGEILSYSLIEYDRAHEAYVLHPLVQTWARTVTLNKVDDMYAAYLLAASLDWGVSSEDFAFLRSLHLHVTSVLQHYKTTGDSITACLASVIYENGQCERASLLQSQVVQLHLQLLGDMHPDTLSAMNFLAIIYSDLGRQNEAEKLQVRVLDAKKRLFGEEHPDTLGAMNNLALIYSEQDRQKEAEDLQELVLSRRRRVLGQEHPQTLSAMNNLANTYFNQGRHKEAENLRELALDTSKQVFGNKHPTTLKAMNHLAIAYSNQGRHEEAEKLQAMVLNGRRQVLGNEHPDTLTAMIHLSNTYAKQSRQKEAEALKELVLTSRKRVLGEEHPATLHAMIGLANTYSDHGRQKEAEELRLQVFTIRKRVLGGEHPDTLSALANLAIT